MGEPKRRDRWKNNKTERQREGVMERHRNGEIGR